MPIRTSPIPHPASSFSNTTPQLDSRWEHHDSSSSPGMVLATPTDAARYGMMRASKEAGARRSVRVRTASGGRNSSSPHVVLLDPPSSTMDESTIHEPPTRPRPSRTSSNNSNGYSAQRGGRGAQATTNGIKTQTLAVAEAHGITPDQFEEARQQVMRFLRPDSVGAVPTPHFPSAQEKGKGRQQLGRSASHTSNSSYTTQGAASMANVGSNSPHLGAGVHEQEHAPRSLRGHSSVDSAMYEHARMEQESRKDLQLRRWAQEESSSSDEEGVDPNSHHTYGSAQRHPSHAPPSSAPGLLPSPSFVHDSQASGPAPSPASLQTSLAKRGMMERFMSDRVTPQQNDDEQQPVASTSNLGQSQARTVFSPGESPRRKGQRNATASPPLRTATDFSPNAVPTSPAPSRGTGPGVLFSPDVAKLLRSELDELEANEQSTKRRASSRKRAADTDITVDDYSSPFAVENSPFSAQSAKRSRDVFTADDNEAKRTRWVNFVPEEPPRAVSPTPSTASLSMRAPSFCDSSPAASDKASTNGAGGRPSYASNTHPASAPDFLYHGLPSSSPASSQHSSSDYATIRHRSSPGPSTAINHAPLQRTQSSASAPVVETTGRKQRGPLKRADTMPALMGADGHQKPSWSYAALIGQAIFSTETLKMSLAEVYQYIMTCYPYYKKEDSGWQNSIRHNLSLNECFVKTARGPDNPGKGCLWAIAPGCEEQFADGNFVKKGGQGNGRKSKGAKAAAAAAAATAAEGGLPAAKPESLPRSAAKRSRVDSPAASSGRGASPAGSAASANSQRQSQLLPVKAPSPVLSPVPAPVPAPLVRTRSTGATQQKRSPVVAEQQLPQKLQRRDSIVSSSSTHLTAPTPPAAALSPPATIIEKDEHTEQVVSKRIKLAAPYEPVARSQRTSPPPPHHALQPAFDNRHSVVTITASPPTSVYHRLAGPYQPISYTQGSPYNHRALALLASPEASGIMPVHPSDFGRPTLHQVPSHSASSSIDSTSGGGVSHFLPAPHIFPGSAGRRSRSEDGEDKEEREPQSMLSPTALVHTQSPISSVRGNPRAPMSPLQASDEKSFSSTSALASFSVDPEKKRAAGLRHIPAVAAIADASFAAETFRSPPPSTSRGHLRSPSGKSFGGAFATSLMSTPGARAGRAWGMSPGVGGADGSWGFGDTLEAELERFGAAGEQVMGSGGSALGAPRLYWPSPGMTNHGAW